MKKLFIFLVVAVATTSFISCLNVEDNGNHTFSVSYPSGSVKGIAADMMEDSIILYASDSYKMWSNVDWVSIPQSYQTVTVPQQSLYYVVAPISFGANTTGVSRDGYVYAKTTTDWSNQIGVYYKQFSWIDITRPTGKYASDYSTATFEKTDSATQEVDYFNFTACGKWTIKCDTSKFVQPQMLSGDAGTVELYLSLRRNESYTDTLRDTLYLTSNGVTTPAIYKKSPLKKKSE